jgi:hypothetical protein
MKPNPTDEIADRDAEERSENEGMPEHPAKARNPVRWAADRGRRTEPRTTERRSGVGGSVSVAAMSCAVLATIGMAGSALRWIRHRGGPARLPR